VKAGLKNNSFRDHIKTLKKIQGSDDLILKYKNFLLKKERILDLRIINIRDKMITHRYTDTNEFWGMILKLIHFISILQDKEIFI